MIPLLYPPIAPLADLPGHLGRYTIQQEVDTSPYLRQWYAFQWHLIGNIGVDAPVAILAPWLGVEVAAKIVVMSIPATAAAGYLWIAHEAHGRIPPTALFAVPLVYNYPFLFGFVNFSISMAWMALAYALWLRLGRQSAIMIRSVSFIIIGPVLWTMHVYGWATLCIVCVASEIAKRLTWTRADLLPSAILRTLAGAMLVCLPLAVPLAMMALWREGRSLGLEGWFDLEYKAKWIVGLFRDRWIYFDLVFAVVFYALFALPLIFRRYFTVNPVVLSAGCGLGVVALLLPRGMLDSWFADVRLIPYAVVLALLAIDLRGNWPACWIRAFALAGIGFTVIRLIGLTASTAIYSKAYTAELAALDHIEKGGRIAVFTKPPCGKSWQHPRLAKLPGLAITRKHAFTNDQYAVEGGRGLEVIYKRANPFLREPSSQVTSNPDCGGSHLLTFDQALQRMPWSAFDYLWLIRMPESSWPVSNPHLHELWRKESSILYRIVPMRDRAKTNKSIEWPASGDLSARNQISAK